MVVILLMAEIRRSPVDMENIPLFSRFYTFQVVSRISAINSRNPIPELGRASRMDGETHLQRATCLPGRSENAFDFEGRMGCLTLPCLEERFGDINPC